MNLLSLILIAMGLLVGVCVFYVAWQLTAGEWGTAVKKEPGESKESNNSPGS
jgi:hypothetical protein